MHPRKKWAHWKKPLENEYKNVLEVLTDVLSCLSLYLDHEKSGKSTNLVPN